nr:peptidase dimerization domain-containing protein [Lactococcus sp. DD01]
MPGYAVLGLNVNFKGTQSHASVAPQFGRSALDALELLNVGIQFLREHVERDVQFHYFIKETGEKAANVVQSKASGEYWIRANSVDQLPELRERLENVIKGAAMMTGTTCTIEVSTTCCEYVPNQFLSKLMHKHVTNVAQAITYSDEELEYTKQLSETTEEQSRKFREKAYRDIFPEASDKQVEDFMKQAIVTTVIPPIFFNDPAGSTDLGDVSLKIPTAQALLACEPQFTLMHSWQWVAHGKSTVAQKGMLAAGEVLARMAVDLFQDKTLIEDAQKEFEKMSQVHPYLCLIPFLIIVML